MNRYEHGKIYMITDIAMTKKYIGSTTESLKKRFERHRSKYPEYLQGGADNTRSYWLFDEFGVENCKILLIKNFPCSSKEELEREEGNVIRESDCINKKVAGRTRKEHYKDENDYICFQKKIYIQGITPRKTARRREKTLRENQAYSVRKAFMWMR